MYAEFPYCVGLCMQTTHYSVSFRDFNAKSWVHTGSLRRAAMLSCPHQTWNCAAETVAFPPRACATSARSTHIAYKAVNIKEFAYKAVNNKQFA